MKMSIGQLFRKIGKNNGFTFRMAEDNNYPEVYFDVAFSVFVSQKLGKETENEFFNFMHSWKKRHLCSIRYICLHKVFEERNMVRIAVNFGHCKPKIVKALIKWLQRCSLPIIGVYMHSDD